MTTTTSANNLLPTSSSTKRLRDPSDTDTKPQEETKLEGANAKTSTLLAMGNSDSPLSSVTSSSSSYIGSPLNFNKAFEEGLVIPYDLPVYNDEQIPVFDPIIHLKYRNSCIPKSINFKQLNLHDCYKNSYLEMVSEGSFPLFSQSCVDIMKWELVNYIKKLKLSKKANNLQASHKSEISSHFASPNLSNCEKELPFSYQAWTNKETINAISAVSGVDLKICKDFEIAHFAERKRKTRHNKSSNNNYFSNNTPSFAINKNESKRHKKSAEFSINRKSIAYPYICLVRLLPTAENEYSPLPPGHCVILQGRILDNLAEKELDKNTNHNDQSTSNGNSFKQTGNYNIVSLATFQPKNIIKYEDSKFFRNCFNYRSDLSKARRLLLAGTNSNAKKTHKFKRVIASGSSNNKIPKIDFTRREKPVSDSDTDISHSDEGERGDEEEQDEEGFENVSSYIDWLQDYYKGNIPGNGSSLSSGRKHSGGGEIEMN